MYGILAIRARINEYLRISIGTDEQMQEFIDFLKAYINQ